MKFKRRKLLLAGLGSTAAVAAAREHLRSEAVLRDRQQLESLPRETLSDHFSIMDAAYASESDWDNEIAQRKRLLSSAALTPPTQPYNRERSKQLIHLCKLAVQQFKTDRANSGFEGDIDVLPAYQDIGGGFTQVSNFTIEQDSIENYLSDFDNYRNLPYLNKYRDLLPNPDASGSTVMGGAVNSMSQAIQDIELRIQDKVQSVLRRRHRISVFSGIVLASKEFNVLVFRGTQTQAEWLKNLYATQQPYVSPSGQTHGEVHEGFLQLTRELKPSPADIVQQLDLTIPCYVTGHSLGAAVATLAALEIVQAVPQLREVIQLYTYASPRVGSPTFAEYHSQMLPNSYRVVNVSDAVPLVPPVNLGNAYTHVGQPWSFAQQYEDALLNHVVDTYWTALSQEKETQRLS